MTQIARLRLQAEEGLVLAIIAQAATDAKSNERWRQWSALQYFRSEWYRNHLQFLDLPEDFLPQNLRRETV